jgi:uncharacterized membrane protein YdjX (TVP38/TMEM64 family)
MPTLFRRLLLVLLVAAIVATWASGLAGALSWRGLAANAAALQALVAEAPARAALLYVAVYAGACILCLPVGALMIMAGGMLFGTAVGAALAVGAASLGALCLFALVRSGLRSGGRDGGGAATRLAERLRPRLERHGFTVLLSLRLVPLFPFWLTNLAAAIAGMRTAPFMSATVLGLVPISIVLASIGAGIGETLRAGIVPDAARLLSRDTILPLFALALLSVLPPLVAALRRRPVARAAYDRMRKAIG